MGKRKKRSEEKKSLIETDELPPIEEPQGGPALDDEEIARLKALAEERDLYLKQLQRATADYENYRRRVARETANAETAARMRILEELLLLADDVEKAAAYAEQSPSEATAQGVALIAAGFDRFLSSHGVTRIDCGGDPFDPTIAEAVGTVPSDQDGMVVEVLRTGYRLAETVLRPAQVIVGMCQTDDTAAT